MPSWAAHRVTTTKRTTANNKRATIEEKWRISRATAQVDTTDYHSCTLRYQAIAAVLKCTPSWGASGKGIPYRKAPK